MSTQPTDVVSSQSLKCVTTQKWVARNHCQADGCGNPIPDDKREGTRYCSRKCQQRASAHFARDVERNLMREIRMFARNEAYKRLHRDQSMSFDGRTEGPLNKSVTVVVSLKKDKGFHAMPIDVHVKPAHFPTKMYTPLDDHEHILRFNKPEKGLSQTKTNFCPNCGVEVGEIVMVLKREVDWLTTYGTKEKRVKTKVVDRVSYETKVGVVKGRYVLQSHVCDAK